MNQNNSVQAGQRESKGRTAGWWRPVLLLLAVVAIIILSNVLGIGKKLGELRGWIQSLGAWGAIVFILLYVVGTVAALPGAALTIAAGLIFGAVVGVICVSIASTLGASLAFLVGRRFARDAVARWASKKEKFRKLDELTKQHGAIIVAITRLVPLFPFNLLNYGFGLTAVPFWTYVFWSWLCMLPGTVLYVVGTDAIARMITGGRIPWPLLVVFGAMIVLIVFLTRVARKRLHGEQTDAENKPAALPEEQPDA